MRLSHLHEDDYEGLGDQDDFDDTAPWIWEFDLDGHRAEVLVWVYNDGRIASEWLLDNDTIAREDEIWPSIVKGVYLDMCKSGYLGGCTDVDQMASSIVKQIAEAW